MRLLGGSPRGAAEALTIPAGALAVSLILFGILVALAGANPLGVYETIYSGAFGSWFSWQNTLQRATPLMLTALCTALPARLGLVVIGAEGALIIGALATVAIASVLPGASHWTVITAMMLARMSAGWALVGFAGGLRYYRGVNETISSLLLNYIAITGIHHVAGGPKREPLFLHPPASAHMGARNMVRLIPAMDVHCGLVSGVVACICTYV